MEILFLVAWAALSAYAAVALAGPLAEAYDHYYTN